MNSCWFIITPDKSAQQISSTPSHNPCSKEIKPPEVGRTSELAIQVPYCGNTCNALSRNRINCLPLKSCSISTRVLGCDKKETSLAMLRLIYSHRNTSECSYIRKAFIPFWKRYPFSFHKLLCSTSVLFFINIALKERSMVKVYGYTQYQADFSNSQDEPKSKNLRRPRTNRTPDACDQKKPHYTHTPPTTNKQR